MDFSPLNLQYLMNVRDLARSDPHVIAPLTGVPDDVAPAIAALTSRELVRIAKFRKPLFGVQRDSWWWQRLINAARDGSCRELAAVLTHDPVALES